LLFRFIDCSVDAVARLCFREHAPAARTVRHRRARDFGIGFGQGRKAESRSSTTGASAGSPSNSLLGLYLSRSVRSVLNL
jgi:hypothetical protein